MPPATATAPNPGPTGQSPQRVILSGVPWKTYSRLLKAFADCPGVRLTYDHGELEIMSPSFRHDRRGHFLCRMVCAITEELDIPLVGGRSTTLRRRKNRRGLEPDDCYWIAHAEAVGDKEQIDLRRDPPPDLAVEIEETRSILDRMGIYASLNVPEIWRIAVKGITFLARGEGGDYSETAASLSFPWLRAADLEPFLREGQSSSNETAVLKKFRAWVRQVAGIVPPQE